MRAAEAHEEQEGQEVQLQPGLPARGQEHLRDLRGQGGRAALRAGRGIYLNLLKLRNLNIVHNFHSAGVPPDVHLRGQGEVHGEVGAVLLQAGGQDPGGGLRRQVHHVQPLDEHL